MDRFVTSLPLTQFTARPPPLLDDDDCIGMGFVFDANGIDEKLENGESVEKRTEVNSGDGREFSEPEHVIGKQDEDEDEEQLSNGMSEFHALQLFDKMPKLDGFDDMENDVKQPVFDSALVSARMYNERHEPHKEFAVDLEHNQYRPFQGLTCLMQISTSTADFIVDTLKLRIHIGPYLREVFKDPPKRKVMHGAGRVVSTKEYQNTNGSSVGNRFLNDNFGEENVSIEDSFGKMQMNSERLCHCETKEIILFCKEAFDRIGEMTQTSLSQGGISGRDVHVLFKLADLCYHSTKSSEELTSLKDYVTKTREGQKDIFYITYESTSRDAKILFVHMQDRPIETTSSILHYLAQSSLDESETRPICHPRFLLMKLLTFSKAIQRYPSSDAHYVLGLVVVISINELSLKSKKQGLEPSQILILT
ncbi:heat shock protein 82-like [Rosa chinensis]|uniref:heat shock protein 82-like n=1 Tax=Rosa chinensis TaxID=74649 RepID=UPI000D08A80C|nr:heat shock protein 82-like [Rosa chinensis]